MKQFSLSPQALADLSDIRSYTRRRWGAEQAEHYLREMGQFFRDLSLGQRTSRAVRAGQFRKARYVSHMIYFIEDDHSMSVIRILHVRMDADRHLR